MKPQNIQFQLANGRYAKERLIELIIIVKKNQKNKQ